jgi:hypothetical protein
MNIENLKQDWKESFEKAVAFVEGCLTPESPDYPEAANFRELAKWLLENPHNTYEYMPEGYQNFLSTPFETKSLLSTLHHALCDDGEVSFVKMKVEGELARVFMIFVWPNEDCFEAICKKENQSLINSYIKGRESHQRFQAMVQKRNPEKIVNIKPPITEKDVTFEAHYDPIAFIRDVEDFQLEQQHSREKTDIAMKKIRSGKP